MEEKNLHTLDSEIIGVVPQDTVMFNDSLRYNVLYGRTDAGEVRGTGPVPVFSFIPCSSSLLCPISSSSS